MKIEIYPNTIETYFTWDEANDFCIKLPGEWRLPTKDELIYMFNTTANEFGNYGCWGDRYDSDYAWSVGFKTGNVYLNLKNNQNYLRPVRDGK
jgi:hypothetical protein